ncbi:MAG: CHAT domain-containing protein, partial [Candidatus Xenobia bacterium]
GGILTAQDVAALDLHGTWLVTLSACDTGRGDVQAGEGVLGMRRAFVMSGAQNVLLTLWPVSDLTTAPLMADFYARARREGDAARALAETQREWMQRLRRDDSLWAAVTRSGGFIMSFQGAP